MCYVTLSRVAKPLLQRKSNKYVLDILALVIQHTKCMRHIMLSSVARPSLQRFSKSSNKSYSGKAIAF